MLITRDNKNQGKWNIGIETNLYSGADGEIRAVKLRVDILGTKEFMLNILLLTFNNSHYEIGGVYR